MKVCQYKSPIGRFLIKLQANGRRELWFKDDRLAFWRWTMSAADDVCMQAAGNCDRDSLDGVDVPMDIHEWIVVGQ